PHLSRIAAPSLHDALPISWCLVSISDHVAADHDMAQPPSRNSGSALPNKNVPSSRGKSQLQYLVSDNNHIGVLVSGGDLPQRNRSEEHTSELQSRSDLVCR